MIPYDNPPCVTRVLFSTQKSAKSLNQRHPDISSSQNSSRNRPCVDVVDVPANIPLQSGNSTINGTSDILPRGDVATFLMVFPISAYCSC